MMGYFEGVVLSRCNRPDCTPWLDYTRCNGPEYTPGKEY